MKNILITDFSDSSFTRAFKEYFLELGVNVRDWDGLFNEMNAERDNRAYLLCADGGETVGFIQFVPIVMSGWFFEERLGFIREFWVKNGYRGEGNGSVLIELAEQYFTDRGIYKTILTTDTAYGFYEKRGYKRDKSIVAKNNDEVYVKVLK